MSGDYDIRDVFSSKGIKKTKNRVEILEILRKSDYPITVEEIFLILKQNNISISLSTVYRAMEMFESQEIILKSSGIDDGKARYEVFTQEHKHHVICVDCHRTIKIDECPFTEIERVIEGGMGFEITGHKFEVYGHCKDCKELKKPLS